MISSGSTSPCRQGLPGVAEEHPVRELVHRLESRGDQGAPADVLRGHGHEKLDRIKRWRNTFRHHCMSITP